MLPAQQHLGPGQAAAAGAQLGLEIGQQLPALIEGSAQLALQHHAVAGGTVMLRVEIGDAGIAVGRSLHGDQHGAPHQLGVIVGMLRVVGDADVGLDDDFLAVQEQRAAERDGDGVREGVAFCLVQLTGQGGDQGVFVIARQLDLLQAVGIQPAVLAGVLEHALEAAGQGTDHRIGDFLAEHGLHVAQVGQVDEDHRQLMQAVALAGIAVEQLDCAGPVVEAGHRIVPGQVANLFFLGDAFGNVLGEAFGPDVLLALVEARETALMHVVPDVVFQRAAQAVVEPVGPAHAHLGPLAQQDGAVLAMHAGQQAPFRDRQLVEADDVEVFPRGADDVAVGIHRPVAETGDLLGIDQRDLAVEQLADGHRRAQQVADAVRQQRNVQRLGDEVGGAAAVGLVDRHLVVEGGEHDDRQVFQAMLAAQDATGFETVHAGHQHVEQQQVGNEAFADHQDGLFGRAGRAHLEFLLGEHRFGDGAHDRLVIDHQDVRLAVIHAHAPSPWPRSASVCRATARTCSNSATICGTCSRTLSLCWLRAACSTSRHRPEKAASPSAALELFRLCTMRVMCSRSKSSPSVDSTWMCAVPSRR